ncbi:surface antigen-domain-containing protein [Gongronella butleri]|nr:surface antigen-domain-containing protein [Gongronella butleri]
MASQQFDPDTPSTVHSLRVLGTNLTRKSFLDQLTRDIFKPQTLGEVFSETRALANQLHRLDIFEEIRVYLDGQKELDVTLQLKEKPRGLIKTALGVGYNEVLLSEVAVGRNLFGGAEKAEVNLSFGQFTKQALEAQVSTPLNGAYTTLSAFGNTSIKDQSQFNAYEELSESAGVRLKVGSNVGDHFLTFALTRRNISPYANASATVQGQEGTSVKSSLYHQFVHDSRDHAAVPRQGHYMSLCQEWAGIGERGDAQFFKSQAMGQYHHRLSDSVSLSLSARAGILAARDAKKVHMSDRLYLGGPLSVRGFDIAGIGAQDGNDNLGGNMYWSVGASVVSDLPGDAKAWPIKLHGFANAGNMASWQLGTAPKQAIEDLQQQPRVSYGAGLIFFHDFGRVEANFCVPVQSRPGDRFASGFQWGIGLHFM